jgi:hypothetical protein
MKTRAVRVAGEKEPRKDLTNERFEGERARARARARGRKGERAKGGERDREGEEGRERISEPARRPGVGS